MVIQSPVSNNIWFLVVMDGHCSAACQHETHSQSHRYMGLFWKCLVTINASASHCIWWVKLRHCVYIIRKIINWSIDIHYDNNLSNHTNKVLFKVLERHWRDADCLKPNALVILNMDLLVNLGALSHGMLAVQSVDAFHGLVSKDWFIVYCNYLLLLFAYF